MSDYNRRYSDNDACWLIKGDAQVSGPFSFNEVLAKLTSGEIKTHFEVMAPADRWRALMAQPLFSAAVEKLKRQIEVTPEYTMTRTESTSFTRTLDLHVDRQTPTPFQQTMTPPPLSPPSSATPPQQMGMPGTRPAAPSRLPMMIVIVSAVAVGGYFFLNKKKHAEPQKPLSHFINFMDRGLASKKVADWYDALKNFKQAHQLNPKDVDLIFEMAPLLIQIESQTMYARSMMEKALVGQYKKENLSLGNSIMGMSYSYESQTKPALKMYDEALAADEAYGPALINKGFALMLAGQHAEAETLLSLAVRQQVDSPLAFLYLLENYVIDGYKNNNVAAYEKAYQLAAQMGQRRIYDTQQEVLLLQAYAGLKTRKDLSGSLATLQRSLSVDPDLTSDHLHSPLIDWRGLNWKYFAFICKDLAKMVKSDLLSQLEFVCAYKMNLETGAQQAVDLLMNRHQRSPLPHVAQAIVSYRLGEYEKAKDSLALAQKLGTQDKLYFQTLVKVCAQMKDQNCVQNNLENVAKISPLHAFAALALAKSAGGEERNQAIYNGLRESKNYLPLVKLQ